MRMIELITKKRDGHCLNRQEIAFFVKAATGDEVPDYQISAMLMAIFFSGMNKTETAILTDEMAKSGDMLDLSALGDKTVDKHSTGGVGDKTTLIAAPIAAALGCTVAKMSGRGLGFTGGTIDKLEAIPGFKTQLSPGELIDTAHKNRLCIVAQTGNLAPADKRLYALRDVTATVDSLPLIAASVMSKKLAAGAKNIVLDVKYGSGAFMKTPEQALELAELMVDIGKSAARNMSALITNMDIPLGFAIGNALEVTEAAAVLDLRGPEDLTELCVNLAAKMVQLCLGGDDETCRSKVTEVLKNKSALHKLCEMVALQGGDPDYVTGEKSFPAAASSVQVFSDTGGYITGINSELIGKSACLCGAGRQTKQDVIDPAAGVVLAKQFGGYVNKGDLLATLYGEAQKIEDALPILKSAYRFGDKKPKKPPLICRVI